MSFIQAAHITGMVMLVYLMMGVITSPVIHGKKWWHTFLLTLRNFNLRFWALLVLSLILMGLQ